MSRAGIATLMAAAALLLSVPGGANAASPVLEFVAPSHGLPVGFTTESGPVIAEMAGFSNVVHCAASGGEGEITGPRSAVAEYRFTGCVAEGASIHKCKSEGASEEEIVTGAIDADLVFLDQAKREVAMLLNPGGGTYIAFECGGESAEGRGPFLAPVSPLGTAATTFTATLSQSGSVQTPNEYEGPFGERLKAVPEGRHGSSGLVSTGVEAALTIKTNVPVEVRAMSLAEVEAEEAAARQREQKQREEEALAKKRQEEEAAAARKHQEEIAAATAAAIKAQEEAAAQKKREEEQHRHKAKHLTRGQLLAKALRQCRKEPKRRRARCVARAHKRYGPKPRHRRVS